jgi:hypothetical protein
MSIENKVPLGTPRSSAKVIPFRRKGESASVSDARIRDYLLRVSHDPTLPIVERVRARIYSHYFDDGYRRRG